MLVAPWIFHEELGAMTPHSVFACCWARASALRSLRVSLAAKATRHVLPKCALSWDLLGCFGQLRMGPTPKPGNELRLVTLIPTTCYRGHPWGGRCLTCF